MIAAVEVRSSLPDGSRFWHVVQTSRPLFAVAIVEKLVSRGAVVELTGTTFHEVAEGRPRVALVHRSGPDLAA